MGSLGQRFQRSGLSVCLSVGKLNSYGFENLLGSEGFLFHSSLAFNHKVDKTKFKTRTEVLSYFGLQIVKK